jgi:hypothetical protein
VDAPRFDYLATAMAAGPSRRSLLRIVLGITVGRSLGWSQPAAAKKGHGKGKGKKKHKKSNPDPTTTIPPASSTTVPPPPPCPVVCPVCQSCNPATGRCEVQARQNGFIGNGCGAPNVCCNGTCCSAPTNQCAAGGICVSCAEVCTAADCNVCVQLTNGQRQCGRNATIFCPNQCSSNADCTEPNQVCGTSTTSKATNSVNLVSETCPPGTPARCIETHPCGS